MMTLQNPIIQSQHYNVELRVDLDYQHRRVYSVIYGLEIERFSDMLDALDTFYWNVRHAAAVRGNPEQTLGRFS